MSMVGFYKEKTTLPRLMASFTRLPAKYLGSSKYCNGAEPETVVNHTAARGQYPIEAAQPSSASPKMPMQMPNATHIAMQPMSYIALSTLPLI